MICLFPKPLHRGSCGTIIDLPSGCHYINVLNITAIRLKRCLCSYGCSHVKWNDDLMHWRVVQQNPWGSSPPPASLSLSHSLISITGSRTVTITCMMNKLHPIFSCFHGFFFLAIIQHLLCFVITFNSYKLSVSSPNSNKVSFIPLWSQTKCAFWKIEVEEKLTFFWCWLCNQSTD